MKLLRSQGTSIGPMDKDNSTRLHRAVQDGHIGMVKLLLKHGPPIESMDNDNSTPLHLAVRSGSHPGIVELLLRNGASTRALDKDKILRYILLCRVVILVWWSYPPGTVGYG